MPILNNIIIDASNNLMKMDANSDIIKIDASNIIVDISHNRIHNYSPQWGTMLTLQGSLNLRIGTQAWKKYISAAFWNYISTPINFTITLFTALTAGQTGTQTTYLTEKQLFIMLFISFLLSIINTFFKLKEKALLNYESSKKYDEFGAKFEEIYYMPLSTENDVENKLVEYKLLQQEINKYSQKESIENVNYFTELIYLCFHCFFEDNLKRINKSDRYWYLDGLTPNDKRTKNPWNVNIKEYFAYDISGQPIILDEEDIKERNDNKYVNSNKKYNRLNTPKRFDNKFIIDYDIESNSFDSYRGLKKMNKNEIIRDINNRENERLKELNKMFVKEKITNCLENSETTIQKINQYSKNIQHDNKDEKVLR
jgi:hypothetical protein